MTSSLNSPHHGYNAASLRFYPCVYQTGTYRLCLSGDLIVQEQHLHTERRVSCPYLQLARAVTLQQALYTLVGEHACQTP